MTDAKDFIDKVAQVSTMTGLLSGVGAMELAGQILSVLYANPEHIPRFMAEGSGLFHRRHVQHRKRLADLYVLCLRITDGDRISPLIEAVQQ